MRHRRAHEHEVMQSVRGKVVDETTLTGNQRWVFDASNGVAAAKAAKAGFGCHGNVLEAKTVQRERQRAEVPAA